MISRLSDLSPAAALWGGLAILVAGCEQHPATAPVQGSVSYNGTPLTFGSVMFQPMSGGQPARGEIGPDGSFQLSTYSDLDGAQIGEHRVRIMCTTAQDPKLAGTVEVNDLAAGQLLIPRKYTQLGSSGLTATVNAEGNEPFDFELTGPKRRSDTVAFC